MVQRPIITHLKLITFLESLYMLGLMAQLSNQLEQLYQSMELQVKSSLTLLIQVINYA